MRLIFLALIFIVFISPIVVAQQKYDVAGTVVFCYEPELQTIVLQYPVQFVLTSATGKTYTAISSSEGNYSFAQVPEGNYRLSALALGFPDNDTTLTIARSVSNFRFCIDKAYRPAPEDSVTIYKNKAFEDIRNGKARIYEWTALSLTDDPFEKLNPKVKKKYGFVYEMVNCARPTTRQEIVQLKLWQAYNQVVYQYVKEKHGTIWRRTIKHERAKLQGNSTFGWLF